MTGAAVRRHIGQWPSAWRTTRNTTFPSEPFKRAEPGYRVSSLIRWPSDSARQALSALRRRANGDRAGNYRRIDMMS